MGKLLRRVTYWFRKRRVEQELVEEIEFHRRLKQERFEQGGMPPQEAAVASRREMGNVLRAREDARTIWTTVWLDQLWQDVGYAVRQLRRSPGFTVIAVLTLAIGIGANSAVFTIVNGILLEALPYKDPQQLLALFEQLPNAPAKFGFSPPDFEFIRKEARSFSGMAAYRTTSYELSGDSQPQRLAGARVTPELFSVLGVAPRIGRAIRADDDTQQARVAVLSHGFWSRAFGRDPSIIGRPILLDRHPYTVIGVLPESIDFPPRGPEFNGEPAEVFVPMAFTPTEREGWGMFYNNTVVARLKPGISLEQARAEMAGLLQPLVEHYPPVLGPFLKGLSMPMAALDEETVGQSRRMLLMLMSAVAIVLLIGCADVANLILTRSSLRQREIAIRSSLGAGPARIARQLLTEGLILAGAGGAFGLLLAYSATRGLLAFAGQTLPRAESINFNYRVVAFTAVVSLVTPLVFAILPAFRTAFANDAEVLKVSTKTATPGRTRTRLLGSLVVAQVALALVVSVGAGLLVRSFLSLLRTNPGFRPEQVVRLTATLPSGRYPNGPAMRTFFDRALEQARRIPGVVSAAEGSELPLGVRDRRAFSVEGSARQIPEASRLIAPSWVSPEYFQALSIPVVRGRSFTDADDRNSRRVVVINNLLAQALWPNQDPIGHRIKWGIETSFAPWMTIVGVVADVKQSALNVPVAGQVYIPLSQEPLSDFFRTINLVVRSNRDANSIISELRNGIREIDPELPLEVQTLTDMIHDSVRPQQFSMTLVLLFAAIALALSALGLYGVLTNVVSQQTHEIGVRLALGATRAEVMFLILRRALTLMGIGIAIGVAGAIAVTRLMSTLLYEVRPTDTIAFLGATALLVALALLASLAPAYRAAGVDPLHALKFE
jgi:predicted permease